MKITNIVWRNPELTSFDCKVQLDGSSEALAFTCDKNDPEPRAREIWNQVTQGKFGPVTTVPLASLQDQKIQELEAACKRTLLGGYLSSALGSPHTYPSKDHDQRNMIASVSDAHEVQLSAVPWKASTSVNVGDFLILNGEFLQVTKAGTTGSTAPSLPPLGHEVSDGTASLEVWTTAFWCADVNGQWNWKPHTCSQIRKAGTDGKSFIAATQGKLAVLSQEVLQASSSGQITAISWV